MNEDDLVTGQRYRISAEVELVSGRSVARVKFEDGAMSYVHTSGFKWEKLLPAEPGLGSVVIDVDGDAWQRHPNGAFDWQMAGADGEDVRTRGFQGVRSWLRCWIPLGWWV